MVREDRIVMSGREFRRVHVIRQVVEHRLTQQEGGARSHDAADSLPQPPTASRRR